MQLPASSTLSKVCFFISLIGFVLYAVGALVNEWLTADFDIPAMPPMIPIPITTDIHMGLVRTCYERKVTGTSQVVDDGCTSDGAKDWQEAAAAMAVLGALASLGALVMIVLNISVKKVAGLRGLKLGIVAAAFATTIFMMIALILYGVNKKMTISGLPLEVDFDIGWAFALSATAAGIHVILGAIALIDTCCSSGIMLGNSKTAPALQLNGHQG